MAVINDTEVLVQDFGATVTKNVKAEPGWRVKACVLENRNAAKRFLQLHDTATTPGAAAVPVLSIPVAASSVLLVDAALLGALGLKFPANGIAYAWSTTAGTYTAATAADHDTQILGCRPIG